MWIRREIVFLSHRRRKIFAQNFLCLSNKNLVALSLLSPQKKKHCMSHIHISTMSSSSFRVRKVISQINISVGWNELHSHGELLSLPRQLSSPSTRNKWETDQAAKLIIENEEIKFLQAQPESSSALYKIRKWEYLKQKKNVHIVASASCASLSRSWVHWPALRGGSERCFKMSGWLERKIMIGKKIFVRSSPTLSLFFPHPRLHSQFSSRARLLFSILSFSSLLYFTLFLCLHRLNSNSEFVSSEKRFVTRKKRHTAAGESSECFTWKWEKALENVCHYLDSLVCLLNSFLLFFLADELTPPLSGKSREWKKFVISTLTTVTWRGEF